MRAGPGFSQTRGFLGGRLAPHARDELPCAPGDQTGDVEPERPHEPLMEPPQLRGVELAHRLSHKCALVHRSDRRQRNERVHRKTVPPLTRAQEVEDRVRAILDARPGVAQAPMPITNAVDPQADDVLVLAAGSVVE